MSAAFSPEPNIGHLSAVSREDEVLSDCVPLDLAGQAAVDLSEEGKCYQENGYGENIALLGVRVDNLSMAEAVDNIDHLIGKPGVHQVATANVDFLTKAFKDPDLLNILNSCDVVLADGMPLVWASRLLGAPLKERVAGADLILSLLDLSGRKKRRLFLLGATEPRSIAATERIRRDYPNAIICGRYSPPFGPIEAMQNDFILEQIERSEADVLLVAFGNPKQEKWIARHKDRLRVPVCIGVGASIDFLSEQQQRAPRWMQCFGLEWVHRALSEPRRLILRYLKDGIFWIRFFSVQLLVTVVQPRPNGSPRVSSAWRGDALIVNVSDAFNQAAVALVSDVITNSKPSRAVILDLTSCNSISADAAGFIARLSYGQIAKEEELWVVGLQTRVRSVLRATFPAGVPFRDSKTLEDVLNPPLPESNSLKCGVPA